MGVVEELLGSTDFWSALAGALVGGLIGIVAIYVSASASEATPLGATIPRDPARPS